MSWEFVYDALLDHHITSIDRSVNPWYGVFTDSLEKRGVPLVPEIFPASTDARFVRAAKFPAFGFSPLRNSPVLLHEHNEMIDESVFLEGIEVYHQLITDLASAPRFDHESS